MLCSLLHAPRSRHSARAQDLATSKGLFAHNSDGGAAAYFKAAKDPVARQLAPRGIVVPTPEDGVDLLRRSAVDAYITEIGILKYYAGLARPCNQGFMV